MSSNNNKGTKPSYHTFSFPSPLPYDDAVFIKYAKEDGLLNVVITENNIRIGHYTGIEAIHCHYFLKIKKPIPNATKSLHTTVENEVIKLRNGRYDGLTLDNIVTTYSKNLALALAMKENIKSEATKEKLLSFDCEYSLPLFYPSDYQINTDEMRNYARIYIKKGKHCHSRQNFLDFFEAEIDNFVPDKIDSILHTLITDGHI